VKKIIVEIEPYSTASSIVFNVWIEDENGALRDGSYQIYYSGGTKVHTFKPVVENGEDWVAANLKRNAHFLLSMWERLRGPTKRILTSLHDGLGKLLEQGGVAPHTIRAIHRELASADPLEVMERAIAMAISCCPNDEGVAAPVREGKDDDLKKLAEEIEEVLAKEAVLEARREERGR